jgi:hypothetical protein
MIVRTIIATFFLLTAATASAAIQSFSGAIQQIATPFSVQENAVENNAAAGIFAEQQGVILAAPLAVNVSTSGVFDHATKLTPAAIPVGTKVNSYFFHADTNNTELLSGEIVFDEPVLGIILGPSESKASHSILGLSSVVYTATSTSEAARAALELKIGEEHVQLNMATSTVNFLVVRDIFFTSNIYDNFRIITAAAAVPEPTALALASCGLALLIARRGYGTP